MSELVKELFKRVDEAVLKHYDVYLASIYNVGKYMFIKVDMYRVLDETSVVVKEGILVLLKRTSSGERILAYSVRVPGNKQLERELRETLRALKREHKKRAVTESSQSSEERHPR